MQKLIDKIQGYNQDVTFKSLYKFIREIDPEDLDYKSYIVKPENPDDYGRNILTLDPFECVMIYWPEGVSSAVHHHEGLFGYVWVLEGELDNIFYTYNEDHLREETMDRYVAGGLISEPDGVIHKLANRGKKPAVSLHFYYPAIETFKGMKIFDPNACSIGILSKDAKTASWSEEEGHFENVIHNAFDFMPYEEVHKPKSHVLTQVIPKPPAKRIREMNDSYFSEQAHKYDFSDFNQPRRKHFIETIDSLVARHIRRKGDVKRHLEIAVGTGRRANTIRELSGLQYEITGYDISKEMCELAQKRGIHSVHSDWVGTTEVEDDIYDSASFLYAFGHLADRNSRKASLEKVATCLKSGGLFFFDVFSLDNSNEWGPKAIEAYEKGNLGDFGYELGDVFYRKLGFDSIAFLHYFRKTEIESLLNETGFDLEELYNVGYAKNPGKIVESDEEGNYFIVARKR